MPSAKSESLTSSLPVQIPLIPLNAQARTSSNVLNNNGESGDPCRFPVLRGKALSFSPLRMIFAVGLSEMGFMMLRCVLSIPIL